MKIKITRTGKLKRQNTAENKNKKMVVNPSENRVPQKLSGKPRLTSGIKMLQ